MQLDNLSRERRFLRTDKDGLSDESKGVTHGTVLKDWRWEVDRNHRNPDEAWQTANQTLEWSEVKWSEITSLQLVRSFAANWTEQRHFLFRFVGQRSMLNLSKLFLNSSFAIGKEVAVWSTRLCDLFDVMGSDSQVMNEFFDSCNYHPNLHKELRLLSTSCTLSTEWWIMQRDRWRRWSKRVSIASKQISGTVKWEESSRRAK